MNDATRCQSLEPITLEHRPLGTMEKAASTLGVLFASKGGRARAAKLTRERRVQIAKHAIAVRWKRVEQLKDEARARALRDAET